MEGYAGLVIVSLVVVMLIVPWMLARGFAEKGAPPVGELGEGESTRPSPSVDFGCSRWRGSAPTRTP